MSKHIIKCCPFCGGIANLRSAKGQAYVDCIADKCPVKPATFIEQAEEEAIAAWNTRPAGGAA